MTKPLSIFVLGFLLMPTGRTFAQTTTDIFRTLNTEYQSVRPTLDQDNQLETTSALPTVNIDNPADGSIFYVNELIPVRATATSPDAIIAQVKFYFNGELIYTDMEAPFEYDWIPMEFGNYEIQVIAIDENNTLASSPIIQVTAELNTATDDLIADNIYAYPNPTNGLVYLKGAKIMELDEVAILDISGKLLKKLEDIESNQIEINMENFPQGVYLLRLRAANAIKVFKLNKI